MATRPLDYLDIVCAVLILVLLLIMLYDNFGKYGKNNLTPYMGEDGIVYYVHRGHAKLRTDQEEVARALMRLQERNVLLIEYLRANYPDDPRTRRLLKNYDPDVVMENSPLNLTGDTAYVMGKGEEFRMCMRSKNKPGNPLHDDSTLTFVQLHEVAHLAAKSYDHGSEFWQTFKWILQKAIEAGIYEPIDYKANPVEYCGLRVDFNPLNDVTLRTDIPAPEP